MRPSVVRLKNSSRESGDFLPEMYADINQALRLIDVKEVKKGVPHVSPPLRDMGVRPKLCRRSGFSH